MSIEPSSDDRKFAGAIRTTALAFVPVFDRARPASDNPSDAIALGALSDGDFSSGQKIS